MDFVQVVQDNLKVVTDAPIAFLVLTLAAGAAAYALARWRFGGETVHLNAIIRLRDAEIADWKRKTEGATPDEVKARLGALEASLRGRRLTAEQSAAITRAGKHPGGELIALYIRSPVTCKDGLRFGLDLKAAFEAADAAWRVDANSTLDDFPVRGGLAVLVEDSRTLKPEELAVTGALKAAGLGFEAISYQQGSITIVITDPDIDPNELRRRA